MNQHIAELELSVLYQITEIIGQALNLNQALDAILSILSRSLSMKRATIILMDEPSPELRIRASYGLSDQERLRGVYRPGEGVTGRIFQTGRPLVIPDVTKEPLFLDRTGARRIDREPVSYIGVPISVMGDPIGVLSVDRLFGAEVSSDEDIRFLSIVSALVAQFVQLNREVEAREEKLRGLIGGLKAELSEKYNDFFMVGRSPVMLEVRKLIEKVAPSRAAVLLLGESGTGKTLVARIIHELSSRSERPYVKVNCAALPENLLESELFGHEKGAFTGASKSKPGRLEEADGGSVFLDEIGELSPSLQAKLLRFLQEKEFERLGSTRTRKVDVRVLAATNRDLTEAIHLGHFREDLYYRLNVFPIRVPPLRERLEDIPHLVTYFTSKLSKEYAKDLVFSDDAVGTLEGYHWPGNVRELENLLERLIIIKDGTLITQQDLTALVPTPKDSPPPLERLESMAGLKELERRQMIAALERNEWVQSRAAQELGMTLRQMGYRIKKYRLESMVRERRAGTGKGPPI